MSIVIWTRLAGKRFLSELARHRIPFEVAENAEEAELLLKKRHMLITDGASYTQSIRAAAAGASPKWIQLLTTGADELARHGVPDNVTVANVGDLYSKVVAEHAVALLLALVRCIPDSVNASLRYVQDQQLWRRVRTLDGLRVGLVGFGNINRRVDTILGVFGCGVSRFARSEREEDGYGKIESIASLPERASGLDALIVALPSSPETRGIVGKEVLCGLAKGCFLVNVGRGDTVDVDVLANRLMEGAIAGAALDVTDPEILPPESLLWQCPNLLITPHVGGFGDKEVIVRLAELVNDNYQRFIQGESLKNVVSV